MFWLLLLGILTLPYNNFPIVGEGALKPLSALFFVPLAVLALGFSLHRKLRAAPCDRWLYRFLGWMVLCSLAAFIAAPPLAAKPLVSQTGRAVQFFLFAAVSVAAYFAGRITPLFIDSGKAPRLLLLAFLPSILAGIHQVVSHQDALAVAIRSLFASTRFGVGYDRMPMLSMEPSQAGVDLACVVIPLALYLAYGSRRLARVAMAAVTAVCLWLLIATGSVNGMAGLAALAVLVALDSWGASSPRTRKLLAAAGLVALGFGCYGLRSALSFVPGQAAESGTPGIRLLTLFQEFQNADPGSKIEESAATRALTAAAALQIGLGHPVLGIGPRNFGYYYREHVPPVYYRDGLIRDYVDPASARFGDVKSGHLEILASAGFPGLLLWACFAFSLLRKRTASRDQPIAHRCVRMITMMFMAMGVTSTLIGYPLFWYAAGLTACQE